MIQKAIGLFGAILTFLTSFTQAVFTPNVIRIDFDNIVDEMRPVHNIGEGKMEIAANKDYGNIYTFKINGPCKVIDRESIEHSAYPDVKWSH